MAINRKRLGELLGKLKETGDQEVLEDIIAMTEDYVLGYALRLVGDWNMAGDLTQTAFLALVRRYDAVQTNVLAWLRGVVRNAWKGELGRRQSEGRIIEALFAATGDTDRQPDILERLANEESRRELAKRLEAALTTLPPRGRKCVWLRYVEGLPPREIASKLELAVTSVYRYTSAGLRKLREQGVWNNASE